MSQQKDLNLEKLDSIEKLLKHLLAVELYIGGASQKDICKHLKISKTTAVELLRGVNKKRIDEKS